PGYDAAVAGAGGLPRAVGPVVAGQFGNERVADVESVDVEVPDRGVHGIAARIEVGTARAHRAFRPVLWTPARRISTTRRAGYWTGPGQMLSSRKLRSQELTTWLYLVSSRFFTSMKASMKRSPSTRRSASLSSSLRSASGRWRGRVNSRAWASPSVTGPGGTALSRPINPHANVAASAI